MESGVHSALPENCHHQITYAPPYEKEVWHYQNANIENIRKEISEFLWEKCFANSDVNEKVYLFIRTIKNIVCNYIPHETLFPMIGIHLCLIKISKI